MAVILSTSQIVQKLVEFFRTAQPLLDTKPGTVARDLLIDAPSVRLSEAYDSLNKVSASQSFARSIGTDLDNLISNFGQSRAQPGRSIGPGIFTFASLSSDISIQSGALVYSKGGISFRVVSTTNIKSSDEARYKALASRIRSDLDSVNITDQYAAEIIVECTVTGTKGNISKNSLISCSVPGVSNVTNIVPFSGGTPAENDSAYRNRIISIFSGSNTGTSLGYANIVSADPAVIDTVVVGPGDPLMVRDNTVLEYDSNGDYVLDADGEPTIVSEGDGGKVDVYLYGTRLTEMSDSYIYNDKSGKNDPTLDANDYTLGQISGYEDASLNKKRRKLFELNTLPAQPVYGIVEVVGSRSGTFAAEIIDSNGISSGNYKLVKDTGSYGGSPFGFDKLKWINNYSTVTGEDITKTSFNGQDTLAYTDLLNISSVRRTITVINENSRVNPSNRSEIYLSHVPIRNVIKVLNLTTGERYVVSNRNPDGSTGSLNLTGKITISGNSLPSVSDVLQVDYEWIFYHDTYLDLDSKVTNDNIRDAVDVIDWGYGNAIRREQSILDITNNVPSLSVTLPISSVVSVNKVVINLGKSVSTNGSGNLQISGLSEIISNVVSIKRNSDNAELYNTYMKNGYFENYVIVLPTDTAGIAGDVVDVYFNAQDLFTYSGMSGSFSQNSITLLPAVIDEYGLVTGELVEVNYIANINEILPTTNLSTLSVTRNGNRFNTTTQTSIGYQPITNIYSGAIVTQNLRRTPTKLSLTFTGITSPGVITVYGTTINLIDSVVFSATQNGLEQDLTSAIRSGLGLSDSTTLSNYMKVIKLISLEKVEVINNTVVTSVINSYDIIGYYLNDASYCLDDAVYDTTLSSKEIRLPSTANNISNPILAGDKLRISFHIATDNDSEDVSISTNGVQYTDKNFGFVDIISIASGFKTNNIITGSLNILATNQPSVGSRYKVEYDYTTPKAGERINIRYNYNSLISDASLRLESQRPITADVLVKEASYILVDVSAAIVVTKAFTNSKTIIAQNVGDQISNTINGLGLGATLHASDLINASYQVNGLDSIRILVFNKTGSTGQVLQIQGLRNQYMRANNINITIEG